jgi:hypothetical protein
MVLTRSQTQKPVDIGASNYGQKYEININFDDATKAWRENKIVLKNGCFEYKATTKYNLRSRR